MRPFFISLFILLIWLDAGAQGAADTVRLASLQATIGRALLNNASQAVYRQQVKQAGYDYKAAKGTLYPHASGEFLGTDNLHLAVTPVPGELVGRPGTTYFVQFGKKYIYNPGITFSQSVFDWQNIVQAQIAKGTVSLSELQQQQSGQALKAQVAQLYYAAQLARASLAIAQHDALLADSLVTLAQQRLHEGTLDAAGVNLALINANNISQNSAQSLQLYDQSTANLKILLGEKPATELQLPEAAGTGSFDETGILQPGPDKGLEVYRQQVFVAGLQGSLQHAASLPRLSVTLYLGAQQFRNDFGLSFTRHAWSGYRYIGLDLAVPLFTGFTNSNKYKSVLTQRTIAQLQYDDARQQSAINDSLLLKNQVHYTSLARASFQNFKLYGDNLALSKQKFGEGIISLDAYLKAFQDYLASENIYLNNLSQLLSARASVLSRQ